MHIAERQKRLSIAALCLSKLGEATSNEIKEFRAQLAMQEKLYVKVIKLKQDPDMAHLLKMDVMPVSTMITLARNYSFWGLIIRFAGLMVDENGVPVGCKRPEEGGVDLSSLQDLVNLSFEGLMQKDNWAAKLEKAKQKYATMARERQANKVSTGFVNFFPEEVIVGAIHQNTDLALLLGLVSD